MATKGVPWPEEVLLCGLPLRLGKRMINVDPHDTEECDDASLLQSDTIIGTLVGGSTMQWYVGPVAGKTPRRVVTAETAEGAVRNGSLVFVARGNNYRLYAPAAAIPAVATTPSKPATATPTKETGGIAASGSPLLGDSSEKANNIDSPEATATGSSGTNKSRKQYSQAVAFEFVSNVLTNVLGEEAETAWSGTS